MVAFDVIDFVFIKNSPSLPGLVHVIDLMMFTHDLKRLLLSGVFN